MRSSSQPIDPVEAPQKLQGRIVKTFPPLEPLESASKPMAPLHAHVSVFTGLFAWALRQNQLGKRANRKVRLHTGRMTIDGLQAPTRRDRNRATFSSYFSFGTQKDLRPLEADSTRHVIRNRILFLSVVLGVIVYTLIWMSR